MDSILGDIRKEISKNDGVYEVDPNRFQILLLNLLWSFVGGYRFDPASTQIKTLIALNIETFEILRHNNPLFAFPFLKVFPKLSGYEHHEEIHKRFQEFMTVFSI